MQHAQQVTRRRVHWHIIDPGLTVLAALEQTHLIHLLNVLDSDFQDPECLVGFIQELSGQLGVRAAILNALGRLLAGTQLVPNP